MEQLKKNTVPSENQLQNMGNITYINPEGKGKRILYVGNSITRHAVKEDLGWFRDCGMAASCVEKDYVHLLSEKLSKNFNDPSFCICQVSNWEREYLNFDKKFKEFELARLFEADIIIMRLIENCPYSDFNHEVFSKEFVRLIDFLNKSKKSDIIVTSGFWKHPGDVDIEKVAKEQGYKFVYLGDLGEDDEMKAIGLFEHDGVANHPGDKGMEAIADRIYKLI